MGTLTSSSALRAPADICCDAYRTKRAKRFLRKLDGFLDLHVVLDRDDHTRSPMLCDARGKVRLKAREDALFHQPIERLSDMPLRYTPNHFDFLCARSRLHHSTLRD
jgi:hypothetical protein